MRWLIVGSLTLPLLVGCKGEERRSQQEQQREAPAGEAADPEVSPWAGAAPEREAPPLAGTGRPGAPEEPTGEGDALQQLLYGQQIEPHGPDQVGIVSGHVASISEAGRQVTVERPDGSQVEITIDEGALVTLNEQPVGVGRLQNLREGDPIRASYRAEDDGNVADRVEIPVGRIGQQKRRQEIQQERERQQEQPPAASPRERGLVPVPQEGESPQQAR